jgi:subtilisin family serine protease
MQRKKGWLALALASALAVTITGGAAAAQGASAGTVGASTGKDQVVTLITGDKVILPGGDPDKLRVERGRGREHVLFRVQRRKGDVVVLPMDVSSAVTSGQLDRRLFDVTGLIRMGYDDAHIQATPLLVAYDGQRRSAFSLPGATVTRELPVIGGAAVRVAKDGSGEEFLSQLGRTARSAAGIKKIWLDGKGRALLDKSVPQIGAPAAWKAGFTGKGVKVAVLDTGIDKSHPDLKTRVVGAKNFTTDPAGDKYGHGTHVASIIAGTAAASSGKYKGVAPDAQLLDGKVCDGEGGCEESALIAAMEWAAVEQKAKVVNISLGWPDTAEVNPMEAAVNRLTAQTGTLFVIAAGNEGPDAKTVDSPGSADAALTVGAVDKSDQLADFSSQGPRLGDDAIKPDVTAPGVDIVAARAKDGEIGEPVGQYYLRLSGTSMATPHVVGAAALLAQEHANWRGPELKAALMGSAKKLPGQGVFAQGAGRIDVAKAITSSVLVSPASLSFGKALWPHTDDKPVAKQLTYRNLGKAPVTLALKLTASSADGKPAPASAFRLSATSLTIPAGGSASVTVTSNTKHNGADTLYSGQVVATAAGATIGTPLAVDKEVQSYDLVLRHLGPNGKGTDLADTKVYSLDRDFATEVGADASGVVKLRLPKGRYFIDGTVGDDQGRAYQLVWPTVVLDRATTASVDARQAKPVRMTLPRADARLGQVELGYQRTLSDGVESNSIWAPALDQVLVGSLGKPARKHELISFISTRWGVPGKDGQFLDSPYTYNLLQGRRGTYFSGYNRTVRDRDLAKVVTQYAADQPGLLAVDERFGVLSGMEVSSAGQTFAYSTPGRATHFMDTADVTWSGMVDTYKPDGEDGRWLANHISYERKYQAGKAYAERWGAAVAVPDVADGGSSRTGNAINVFISPNADGDGHSGDSLEVDQAAIKLYRNGKLIGSDTTPGQLTVENVATGKGVFRLEASQVRSLLQLATRMSSVWTFSSQDTGSKEVPLPLWVVRPRPAVDLQNSVARQPLSILPLDVATQPGAKVGAVKQVTLQVSGDGGKTWRAASVVRTGKTTYKAIFRTPAGAKLISLRSTLTDKAGNTAGQTVINAYRIR